MNKLSNISLTPVYSLVTKKLTRGRGKTLINKEKNNILKYNNEV